MALSKQMHSVSRGWVVHHKLVSPPDSQRCSMQLTDTCIAPTCQLIKPMMTLSCAPSIVCTHAPAARSHTWRTPHSIVPCAVGHHEETQQRSRRMSNNQYRAVGQYLDAAAPVCRKHELVDDHHGLHRVAVAAAG